jgi:multisubunit Na+/H+ antiporter MnhE subunit
VTTRSALRGAAALLVRAGCMFAIWLVLVDNPHTPELVAGAVVAVLAALAGAGIMRVDSLRPQLRWSMLRRLHRPFLLLVTDSARVTVALVRATLRGRRLSGTLRHEPFAATADTRDDQARRVLSEWASSLGPNRYALGVDREREELLVHELVRSRGPLDPLELG